MHEELNNSISETKTPLDYRISVQQLTYQLELMSNAFYPAKASNEPFKVVYRSKPIQGIVLELVTLNEKYISPIS